MRNTDLTFNRVNAAVKPKHGVLENSVTVIKGTIKSRTAVTTRYTYEVDISGDGNTIFGVAAIGVSQALRIGRQVELIQTYDGGLFIIGARTHPIQNGVDSFTFANTVSQNRTVVFPLAFAVAPHVQLSVEAVNAYNHFIINGTITTTQFQYQLFKWDAGASTETVKVHWTAHEKET